MLLGACAPGVFKIFIAIAIYRHENLQKRARFCNRFPLIKNGLEVAGVFSFENKFRARPIHGEKVKEWDMKTAISLKDAGVMKRFAFARPRDWQRLPRRCT